MVVGEGAVAGEEASSSEAIAGIGDKISAGLSIFKSIVGGALSLYNTIDNLISAKNRKGEIIQQFKDKWHQLGLVIPSVDVPQDMSGVIGKRSQLVASGIIPKPYSYENIVALIKDNKLPPSWDDAIAINQGFAGVIQNRDRLASLKNKDLIKEAQEKLNLQTKKNFAYFDEKNKDREAKRIASGLRFY